ncbi:DNA (cytosine-5)-methyltransferase CMT2-like isoform X2 [Magnolia sinica]|nr:DNA (cytosine-5)-methyltransferase CMT2-like isoform X2 [Magnolia sinica]
MEGEEILRRSPRGPKSTSSAASENGSPEAPSCKNGSSKAPLPKSAASTMSGEKILRKSPRLVKSPEPELGSSTMSREKILRKSPRMMKSPEPELGSSPVSREKILRKSPRLTRSPEPELGSSTMSGEKILRKSPRLTRSPEPELSSSTMSGEKILRKSPRLTRSSEPELGSSTMSGEKILRKSPRLTRSPEPELGSSTMSGEKILRKSPRLMKSPEPELGSSTPEITGNGSSRKSPRPNSADLKVEKQSSKKPKVEKQSSEKPKVEKQSSEKPKVEKQSLEKPKVHSSSKKKQSEPDGLCVFMGDPIPMDEARKRWPRRYEETGKQSNGRSNISTDDDEDEIVLDVKCHYSQADVARCIINLGDCAYVKGVEGRPNYIGRILEFFETVEGQNYFTVQWFFRAGDTVMKEEGAFHDEKRVFYSDLRNDNLLECLVSKVKIVPTAPRVGLQLRTKSIPPCDFYYDMKYSVDYTTFSTMATDNSGESSNISSSSCIETVRMGGIEIQSHLSCKPDESEVALLDLYSGCGAMSTGLCLGAKFSGVNLVTRWAVDFNESACQSLRLNHPETQVRNETAEDFLDLLKEWEKLCKWHVDTGTEKVWKSCTRLSRMVDTEIDSHDDKIPPGEYEVLKLVDICYGDPCKMGKRGLRFKVRWAGYGPSEDTWELIEELSNCQDRIQDFVREGFKSKILPLPGDVDVICGGPPCQGISGHNRHRNVDAPLDDERNHQIVVFMDIVKFLQPKYVLMENVVDILKFAKGCLGRYALSRLVHMNYQARLGIMAAGCYGLPQFRLRVFLWGAHPYENLPQYPLPTHDVVLRGSVPTEFERSTVAYDEEQPRELEDALLLSDAISELPSVTNDETNEEMPYGNAPQTEFQRFIRSTIDEMTGSTFHGVQKTKKSVLYDHRPIQLNEDDYMRVCQIPRRKGANFRDLPGVIVGGNNVVKLDPTMERVLLPSGKPL